MMYGRTSNSPPSTISDALAVNRPLRNENPLKTPLSSTTRSSGASNEHNHRNHPPPSRKSHRASTLKTVPSDNLKSREQGFNVRGNEFVSIPKYDSLRDYSLKDYFSSEPVKKHLQKKCFVNSRGKPFNLEQHKQTISIIEQSVNKLERRKKLVEMDHIAIEKKKRALKEHEDEVKRRKDNYLRRKQEEAERQARINALRNNPEAMRTLIDKKRAPLYTFRGSADGHRQSMLNLLPPPRPRTPSSLTNNSQRRRNSEGGLGSNFEESSTYRSHASLNTLPVSLNATSDTARLNHSTNSQNNQNLLTPSQ